MKKKNKSNPFVTFIKTIFLIAVAFLLAFILMLQLFLVSQPPIRNLGDYKPNQVTKIYSADGELIKTFTAYKYEHVNINNVPKNLINALVATEDKNFYKHSGYDLFGILRSAFANVKAGRTVQGASTITQQLARILFLSNERSFNRKIKEIIISARIEKSISKSQILEMYLNNVYLGSGTYGAAGAASAYFNKPLKDLTLAECALIAGLPQAPSVYSPYNNKELALKRRNQVLKRMYKMKYITKDEYKKAADEPINLNKSYSVSTLNRAPYFVDYVMQELEKLGFDETDISQGGYKITTTLNYKDQIAAENSVRNNLASWGLKGKNNQAALFSFSVSDGKILMYVGGKNYAESQYDRITQAVRPPGSSFKPFVYATAVYKGWNPNDPIQDTPYTIADWSPRNYGNKYRGTIPLYKALAVSSNVAAARLIESTGVKPVIIMARELGITTPISNDSTIALGSNGVKLFDMAVAYGVFANGGVRVKPYAVEKVETARGKTIYTAGKTQKTKVLHFETAGAINSMLQQVILAGTGTAAKIGVAQAGKTGTTDDYKDAWFVGYTPDIVTAVWVGNDDNTKLNGLTGGTLPAFIWRDAMKTATENLKDSKFEYEEIELKSNVNDKPAEQKEEVPDGQITEENEIPNPIENNNDTDISSQKQPQYEKADETLNFAPVEPVPVNLKPAEPVPTFSENFIKQENNAVNQSGRFR